ncbi:MAG: SLBB domain-containing protein [Kiritimatiellia bacterium]
MRLIAGLLIFALIIAAFAGCATDRGEDIDKLLRELGVDEMPAAGEGPAAHSPEPPSLGRPPKVGADSAGEITIQPNSLVKVKVAEDPSLDGSYAVNEIGAIELNYVGPVILYNMTALEASRKIRKVLEGRFFQKGKATVAVEILRPSYDKVRVAGAVNKPGIINIGAGDGISLNNALRRAGGVRVSARGAKVRIVRNGLRSALVLSLPGRVYSLVTDDGEPFVPDITLDNNDFVYVFFRQDDTAGESGEKKIIVLGEVKRRGVYSFAAAEPCTLMHLIFKMGGLPRYADTTGIRIYRRDKSGEEKVKEVNAREILETGDPDKDFNLENGDRVKVPARRLTLF